MDTNTYHFTLLACMRGGISIKMDFIEGVLCLPYDDAKGELDLLVKGNGGVVAWCEL